MTYSKSCLLESTIFSKIDDCAPGEVDAYIRELRCLCVSMKDTVCRFLILCLGKSPRDKCINKGSVWSTLRKFDGIAATEFPTRDPQEVSITDHYTSVVTYSSIAEARALIGSKRRLNNH